MTLHLISSALLVMLHAVPASSAGVSSSTACEEDSDCIDLLGRGSVCNANTKACSNPFESGCLYQRLPGWDQKRVCNSEDSDETIQNGVCVLSHFAGSNSEYPEVRIASGNWESITFNAWLLQILYSEILGVPTTLEPGIREAAVVDFYHPTGGWEWGESKVFEAFERAHELQDCRKANRAAGDGYEACANISPEFWNPGPWTAESVKNGIMEPPEALGVLSFEGIFIPKFTAQKDPSLLSYIGMQGEENRQKLADAFLRPTLWSEYCTEVSNTSCSVPDGVARRAPKDVQEGDAYYNEGMYTGHFRKTKENYGNATHPATGHLIDYPCDWNSYAEPQLYHLDIAISGDRHTKGTRGYEGRFFEQILAASNATKSNILIMYAMPDPYYQKLIGTDMELHAVTMPPVTQKCLTYKRRWDDECSADWEARVGDPRGACDNPPSSLYKVISTSISKTANDLSMTPEAQSPALATFHQFTVTTPIYGSWFDLLLQRGALSEERRTLMRDATCSWVVDNFDLVQQWVPFSYPRAIEDGKENYALVASSVVMAALAVLSVLTAFLLVHRSQHRKVIQVAQVTFLNLLLVGLLLISIGALLAAIPPSNGSCIVSMWLINVGYTLELAPLLVKVAAINSLLSASARMQRVVIDRQRLYQSSFAITAVIVVFLAVWSAVDPPAKEGELSLSTSLNDRNETIVHRTYYCSSESDVWQYVAIGWILALLLRGIVLAFEMRNVRQDFNESQTLAMMTYSHFVFSMLRLVVFVFLLDDLGASESASYNSILLSFDTMAALVIYFLPKFVVLRNPDASTSFGSSRIHTFLGTDGAKLSCVAEGTEGVQSTPDVVLALKGGCLPSSPVPDGVEAKEQHQVQLFYQTNANIDADEGEDATKTEGVEDIDA